MDSPIIQDGFLFENAPFRSCHASTIAETPDGLIAAWFGGTHEKHPDVGIWVARRDGERWLPPVEVATGTEESGKRYPTWNPVLFALSRNDLRLFYKVGPSPDTWWGMVLESADCGKIWSAPVRLPEGILGPIKNKPVALPDGTILSPTSTEHNGWRIHFERSTDGGETWTRHEVAGEGAIQPSVLLGRNGHLLAPCRSRRGGKLLLTESHDSGRTWSPLRELDLPNPNSGTDAVTLADGRHLLVYNHTSEKRTPLNLALSPDGIHWKRVWDLETEPGEYSYPAVIQGSDGTVHLTYTWNRTHIRYVALDPARLPDPMD
ncbi:MAG: exo-alpha-sialidase [Armatimonadaceae bacterium]